MASDSNILGFIDETQRDIFRDAQLELQIPLKAIASKSGIPYSTLLTYANGTPLPLTAIKRLLRIKRFGPLLSRLFAPEDHCLARLIDGDHDGTAAVCMDYLGEYTAARHPESECGVDLGPNEKRRLTGKRTALKAVA